MLENTFCHLPGIGLKTEQFMWASGLRSWSDVLESGLLPWPSKKAEWLRSQIQESVVHLENNDPRYFYERLPPAQHWRMFPEFRHSVAYLDIETTGLGGSDYATTIALYDGRSVSCYVHGDNLMAFRDDIDSYPLLVTYNGKCFDVPFLRWYLGIPMKQAHLDLRYVLASLGYQGGLKGCERQFGIDREELEDVGGFFAVLLWFDFYYCGNPRALETLLAYNTLDAVNLETLMVLAYNLKIQQTPFAQSHRLPLPTPPEIPFRADVETIQRIKWEIYNVRYNA
jgi:uncharacterized protein YprB with RNaseH-like and TPR domain